MGHSGTRKVNFTKSSTLRIQNFIAFKMSKMKTDHIRVRNNVPKICLFCRLFFVGENFCRLFSKRSLFMFWSGHRPNNSDVNHSLSKGR